MQDVAFNYYGTLIAIAKSDGTVSIADASGESPVEVTSFVGHKGAVWGVCWSHPRFGVLATCGYDGEVKVWRENASHKYDCVYTYHHHKKSVNCVSFFPGSEVLKFVCGSSDGEISVVEYIEATKAWKEVTFDAHPAGVTSVSLYEEKGGVVILSGGCDSVVRIHRNVSGVWKCVDEMKEHADWIRGVDSKVVSGVTYIASCSNDKSVVITQIANSVKTTKKLSFDAICWKVAFSVDAEQLAVSLETGIVKLFKRQAGQWVDTK
ncbi:protein transport protein SEC13, putative [Entamoeba invadens IP1]|uniref:protein transport protein SEC13, putative n=1 Tax=Entamoeba invadens IP1 TaxID=370355 RepID=UPI0002C3DB64|nr:protein transport protein SEC13, putative [Entamoeba invadens IP1]XP_004184379.1 protein transport protein SEC13, putative [Entamoeba invadens IP1]ELP85012.1 protein transport protein SEC13, putative [Entamoeba invadens IP1]ELP85033.1 protein transport protein SEC13, putative [Entamoeba invadens IP1]|eukprot:XP_004184358.1 protein transport protein SEC13, putative [Entamoeba invadens IP1]